MPSPPSQLVRRCLHASGDKFPQLPEGYPEQVILESDGGAQAGKAELVRRLLS